MRFTDTKDREWVVRIDAVTLEEMRDELGVDLADPDGTDLAVVYMDEVKLVRVLWVACRDSAPDTDFTFRDFSGRVRGEVLEGAWEALRKTLRDFFPGWKQRILDKQVEMLTKAKAVVIETAEKVTAEEIDRLVREAIEESTRSRNATSLLAS